MRNYRRTTSCWLISQTLCFSLLFQGTGIADALPVSTEQTFLSQADLEAALANPGSSTAAEIEGKPSGWLESAWSTTADAREDLVSWARSSWLSMLQGVTLQDASASERVQLASASGLIPVPSRLMSFFMASTSRGQSGPPGPPGMASDPTESKPPVAMAGLMRKDATEGIQLLTGYNLISIPEEPADPTPSAVFAGIAADLVRVEAYDACDLADPWKLYDPVDPAASDLTAVDYKIGMWVKASAPVVLPSDGTLPETTTLQLCEGWNLIGFPAGQPRHPEAVLAPIAGKWERLFGYDVFDSVEEWELYDPAVPAWVNDLHLMYPGRGYWLLASEATTLEIRNQGPPPTVSITSPADLAVITEPTEIIGSVGSDLLESWTLTYREFAGGDPVTLVTSSAPVSGSTLATFDPTLLLNGLYELELTATDVQGQQVSESIAVSVEGQMKIGHFTLSFVDLAIPVLGLDIEVVRTYDSRDKQQRDFGVGWRLDIRQGSYVNNRPPGDGWQLQTGFLPCDTVLESKSHLTVVRLSDLEVYRFALRLFDGTPTGGGCFATARFDYVDGPLPGSTLEILGNTQVFYENGGNEVIDANSFELYVPGLVKLTTRDGRIFELDLSDGVTRLQDLNGNHLTINPSGISHSTGRSIAFERDVQGRIERIIDPEEEENLYSYDAAGDLVAMTDRAGAVTTFTYRGNHHLEDIVNPLGVRAQRMEYDEDGRIIRIFDAAGNPVLFEHDLENRREVITDRLGATRVFEYDERGNTVREIDENGALVVRSFDPSDNVLSVQDPLGYTTLYQYNAFNDLTKVTDPLGHAAVFTNDGLGMIATVTDALGHLTRFERNSQGKPTRIIDPLDNSKSYEYASDGGLESQTDALGRSISYQYDGFGNLTKEIDAFGKETLFTYDQNGRQLSIETARTLPDGSTEVLVTRFTYDALGRVLSTEGPGGGTRTFAYDLLGQLLTATDELGRSTTFAYDALGRLVAKTWPDQTSETRSYDVEGRLVASVDRQGRQTDYQYDPAGRQIRVTHPDGTSIAQSYDAAGRVVSVTDSRENTTTFERDELGRLASATDPLGGTRSFTYDETGRQTSVTDERGQTTLYSYDAAGRIVGLEFPDGSTRASVYDVLGRVQTVTDGNGNVKTFGYDAEGRIASVIDALNQTSTYTYDEVGNRLSYTDANGRTTRFEYDSEGRQRRRILPDGSVEVSSYLANGLLSARTDMNGAETTFEYDINGRLTRRRYVDGSSVGFTYTATGRRASMTDARGVTTYGYDLRDRLVRMTYPDGRELRYEYDSTGNRSALTADLGTAGTYTTSFVYDANNRLTEITDPVGRSYAQSFDAGGNLVSREYPNLVTADHTYDARSRLASIITQTSSGESQATLATYTFTVDSIGNRTSIDEIDDLRRSYSYDVTYRLTRATLTDSAGATIRDEVLSYDPVGNRLSQQVEDQSGVSPAVGYAYDGRDRLLSVGPTTYGWDDSGQQTSEGGISYEWNLDHQLGSVTLADGTTVTHIYSGDGLRVGRRVARPDGSQDEVRYLVDPQGPLPQVVAETDAAGGMNVVYVRGQDLLASIGSDGARFYHSDGIGSVRLLTDDAGEVTDRYSFSAFGELLDHDGQHPNEYLFAGERLDPVTGLYDLRARWMDPRTGRFISTDPFPGLIQDPQSLHRYTYAHLNPVNNVDPTGLFTAGVVGFAVAAVVVGTLAAIPVSAQTTSATQSPRGRDWEQRDAKYYQQWVELHARIAGHRGYKIDCADLAIDSVITYAQERKLHLPLYKEEWKSFLDETHYGNYEIYKSEAKQNLGGVHLAHEKNTRSVPVANRLGGDLLILRWSSGEDAGSWHVFLYTDQGKNQIWFGNLSGGEAVEIDWFNNNEPRILEEGEVFPEHYLNHEDLVGKGVRRWQFIPQ